MRVEMDGVEKQGQQRLSIVEHKCQDTGSVLAARPARRLCQAAALVIGLSLGPVGLMAVGCSGSEAASPTPLPGDLDGDGYNPDSGDCNESSDQISPAATESCNGLDDDCDGEIDPGCDADGDGFQSVAIGGADCDDSKNSVYPGAEERCDTLDNNCDGIVDNPPDRDGDGFQSCGTSTTPADCNDGNATIYPGADELFDGTLNDCAATSPVEALTVGAARGTLIGEYAGDRAGFQLSPAGDLNDDGYDDLAIAAPFANAGSVGDTGGSGETDTGKVYLLFGGPDFELAEINAGKTGVLDLSYADTTLAGSAPGDTAGTFLAGVGDVNGDGLDDLWVGAPGADSGAGRGYLLLGRLSWPPLIPLADADVIFEGSSASAALGPVAGGDFTGDGNSDLLIGAPGEENGLGAVYLLQGGPALLDSELPWTERASRIGGLEPGGRLGQTLSPGNDVQGDGVDDLLMGAPGASLAYVMFGRKGEWIPALAEAEVTLVGTPGEGVATALTAASDINGDGYADLLIGAPLANTGGGKVYGILGKPSGLAVEVPLSAADLILDGPPGAGLGTSVSGGGDVTGDDLDDVSLGGALAGTAWLLAGQPRSIPVASGAIDALAEAVFRGETDTLAGASVCIAGDLNQDGPLEWAIGAPAATDGGQDSGNVYLFYGHQ